MENTTGASRSRPENTPFFQPDFDGDNKLDIAVVSGWASNSLNIYRNNGTGSFALQSTYAAGNDPSRVACADFNNDGKRDLIVAASGSSTSSIMLGNGDGTFQAITNYSVGDFPMGLDIADLNNDGAPDIVVGNRGNNVSQLMGNAIMGLSTPALDLTTQIGARTALTDTATYLDRIETQLAKIGSSQSCLSVTGSALGGMRENLLAAAARIIDADVAEESARLIRSMVMQQAAAAVLAHTSHQPELLRKLLE